MIFKLYPAHKDYLWGGTRLNQEFNKNKPGIVAETWELSIHPDGISTIIESDSPYNGRPLTEYLAEHPEAIGSNQELPVLIKFIDAKQDLSIQVHPDDAYALANENENGKTECWYILDAEPDAFLYFGVNRSVSREEFQAAILNNQLLELLNKVPVKKGDFFFIPAGTIHAIGAGIMIAEIQQNSNVTYRVYDFDRKDAQGNTRPLHIEKALEVSNLEPSPTSYDFSGHLCQCPYFTVDKVEVSSEYHCHPQNHHGQTSFHSLLILEGEGQITDGEISYPLRKGDSFFISADHQLYTLNGSFTMLQTTLGTH